MLKFSLFDELGSNYGYARFLGTYQVLAGNVERGVEILTAYKNITAKDLQKTTQKYLTKNQRTIVIGVPKK